jgi:hypothetical protein
MANVKKSLEIDGMFKQVASSDDDDDCCGDSCGDSCGSKEKSEAIMAEQVKPSVPPPKFFADQVKKAKEEYGEDDDEDFSLNPGDSDDDVSSLKFGEDIRILLIPSSDWRLICYFLGVNQTRNVHTANYANVSLIGSLMHESLERFMKSKRYKYSGEIMFDQTGAAVPVGTRSWTVKGDDVVFTNIGFRFFEAPGGKQKDNIVFQVFESANTGQAGLACYHRDMKAAKRVLSELEAYTKTDNCLRGSKIRDVNMSASTFSEVVSDPKYNWENYYFSDNIKEMFELEVFGFLKNTERYNKVGIKKRGVMLHGPPGTGKTTIGHIICNYSKGSTVIWITPELIAENNGNKVSIKLLYMLTDFVAPSVIVLEDLDLFSEDREGVVDQLRLGALMNILDGVNSVTNAVTVATTNRLGLVEKALANRPGRFDRIVEVPTLNAKLRKKMFTDRTVGIDVQPDALDHLVKNTDGWTGAEAQEFINSMNLYFINRDEDNERKLTKVVVTDVLKTMNKFGINGTGKKSVGFNTESD